MEGKALQPFVSVVTPFYNTREFLAECIESVLSQCHRNFEYILIDNCSNDGSSEIAEKYASRYSSKIRLIRPKSFLSQVANYNFGLSCISPASKYCKIVQADDWIFPECLERMVSLAESDPLVGIVSAYRLRGDQVLGGGLPYMRTTVSGPEICRSHLMGAFFLFGSSTTILYRSEIIRGTTPFFEENVPHEDTDSCYLALRTWNFGFVHQVLSFTRLDNDSIRGRVLDFNPDALDWLLQVNKFGPHYLKQDELDLTLRKVKANYYRFLARGLLRNWRGAFWQYHISGLRSGGLRLEKGLLVKHLCLRLIWHLTNPGLTCARVFDHFRART
jgi:glycosyltransferase involved in cell wall biosynthesis